MRKPGSRGKSGRTHTGGLSTEELTLWWHVVGGVTPLAGKDSAPGSGERDSHEERRHPLRQRTVVTNGANHDATVARADAATNRPRPPPASIAAFDPRAAKKLARGRIGIDARLDLHGLRHDEARLRLRHFLRDAHARGHATVLVITGKGRAFSEHAVTEPAMWEQPRGVLRRSLPGWLAEPDMLVLVSSFTSASARHGGDGAVYIRLRRRR